MRRPARLAAFAALSLGALSGTALFARDAAAGPASSAAAVPDPAVAQRLRQREAWQRTIAARSEATPEQKGEALGEVAGLYYAYALPGPAEPLYRQAQQTAPRDPRWPYYLGQLYRGENRPAESIAMFRRAVELAPRDVAARVRLGEVLIEQGRLDEAAAQLGDALELDPRCAAADFRLGVIANARGDRPRAAQLFAAALALQPEATAIHHALGLAYRALGREDEARAELKREGKVEVALDDPLMARLYGRVKPWQEAMAKGDAALAAGRVADAVAAYRAAVALDLLDVQSRVRLGAALLRQGDEAGTAGGREQLELALKIAPDDPEARFALAYLRLRQGEAKAAIADYRAGLKSRPDDVWARFNLAGALRESGAPGEALQEYARLAQLAPQNALVWLGRATALLQLGRCAEARQAIESGAARLPRDGALAQAQARLLATCPAATLEGRGRDAARALEIASALYASRPEPEHAEALAMALAATGRYGEAVERQQQAIHDAEAAGKTALLPELRANLALFQAGKPSRTAWPPERMGLLTLAK